VHTFGTYNIDTFSLRINTSVELAEHRRTRNMSNPADPGARSLRHPDINLTAYTYEDYAAKECAVGVFEVKQYDKIISPGETECIPASIGLVEVRKGNANLRRTLRRIHGAKSIKPVSQTPTAWNDMVCRHVFKSNGVIMEKQFEEPFGCTEDGKSLTRIIEVLN
jgi:hypothetical protein